MLRAVLLGLMFLAISCSGSRTRELPVTPKEKVVVNSNEEGKGPALEIELVPGKEFYYPLFAVWIEDIEGEYIQTLYVARSVATGVFKYGRAEKGEWKESPKRAPQTLPYWAHKRGIRASDGLYMPEPANPVADAYTGPTPVAGFILQSRADSELPVKFRLMFEINQNWDWNEYWTNDKYPGDENYMMSCQPALVYQAVIDQNNPEVEYLLKPVGHSHYSGKTGELFPDLSTITSALEIADSIIVRLK